MWWTAGNKNSQSIVEINRKQFCLFCASPPSVQEGFDGRNEELEDLKDPQAKPEAEAAAHLRHEAAQGAGGEVRAGYHHFRWEQQGEEGGVVGLRKGGAGCLGQESGVCVEGGARQGARRGSGPSQKVEVEGKSSFCKNIV